MTYLARSLFLLLSVLLSFKAFGGAALPEPEGELLLAVALKESAFTGVPAGKHGYFLYVKDPGPFTKGPLVTGYRYANGTLVDVFGGGSSGSLWFLGELESLSIGSFDYAAAMAAAKAAKDKEEITEELGSEPPIGMNDGEYSIQYSYGGSSWQFSDANPGPQLREYARYSDKLSKVSELVNLLGTYYGLMKIGM